MYEDGELGPVVLENLQLEGRGLHSRRDRNWGHWGLDQQQKRPFVFWNWVHWIETVALLLRLAAH